MDGVHEGIGFQSARFRMTGSCQRDHRSRAHSSRCDRERFLIVDVSGQVRALAGARRTPDIRLRPHCRRAIRYREPPQGLALGSNSQHPTDRPRMGPQVPGSSTKWPRGNYNHHPIVTGSGGRGREGRYLHDDSYSTFLISRAVGFRCPLSHYTLRSLQLSGDPS